MHTGQGLPTGSPDVAGRPQQLGVGVAHVEAVEPAGREVPQHRPAGELVVGVLGPRARVYGPTRPAVTPVAALSPPTRGFSRHDLNRRPARFILSFDISLRYIDEHSQTPRDPRSARTRRPRPAQGAAAPRLRAEEAPERDPRLPLGRLLRLALSRAAPPRAVEARSTVDEPNGRRASTVPATGSLSRRPRRGPLRAVTGGAGRAQPQGVPHHRRGRAPSSSSSCSHDDPTAPTTSGLRPQARLLPAPRPGSRASSCSSGAAPSSPTGSPAPAAIPHRARRPLHPLAVEHRTCPPSTTSSGSRN